ncbi:MULTISPECIES: siroheme synthase CysG [Rhodomicrobium]|uniref:siroheme synthase CysG n=1 Tax=Rhodomicrobium TaxID=1068 RepID=UPI000B4AED33|nr:MULTISPECIES: siroheme synthase CysG [Rhodomicrobium]
MDHLPIFLDIRGKTVIVAGGGTLAARRVERALSAGARVKVFADGLSEEFAPFLGNAAVTVFNRLPELDDVKGAILAYGAEEDFERDKRLRDLATAAGVLANVADTMELCDFITPAILDRTPLVAAISSSGASPILARIIKAELESAIPATFGDLSGFLGRFRDEVAARITEGVRRRRFWEDIAESAVAERVMAGDFAGAETALRARLDAIDDAAGGKAIGEVYLVGTGPGDPDLLTFRALRLMQRADVVLYDRLIGPRIMDLVRRDATRIYVGKQANDHTMSQEEISQTLVRLALEGQRVLRLKGGDPFIFGRGGEEIEEIARHGIPFQVVPGITAAAGCAAYAGIPLTHRDHAQTCIFVTGHGKNGEVDLNWEALIQPRQTVAIYMGLATIDAVMAAFVAHGAAPEMPVAVIDNGTRRRQRVVAGTLADIGGKTVAAGLKGPAIIIIGTVVTLRDRLAWFEPGKVEGAGAAGPDK